ATTGSSSIRRRRRCWRWGIPQPCGTPHQSRRFAPSSGGERPTPQPQREAKARDPRPGRCKEGGSMGRKINPTTTGAFVVGAIVLLVAGTLLFGGGKFLQEKLPYVLFFDSSVEGLNVGAPVIFRGVQMGQVTAISAIANPQTYDIRIKVKIDLVRGTVKVGAEGQGFQGPRQAMQASLQKGGRATLRMQSLVTGLLYVALDFFPDTPVRLLGLDPTVPELPTIPSDMDQLKSSVQQALADLRKLPLETILNEVL